MRGTCYQAVVCLRLLVLMSHLALAPVGPAAPLPAQPILHLHYRSDSAKWLSNPYSVGMFESETHFHRADFMGNDWDGNIYIMDPIEPDRCVLKRFDRHGRFRQFWDPVQATGGGSVAVTKDGYIWTGLGWVNFSNLGGLPIVVYGKEKKQPVLDWRKKLPKFLETRIRETLQEKGLEWKPGEDWSAEGLLQCGPRQVSMWFIGPLGNEGGLGKVLWLLMRSDGNQVLDARVCIGTTPSLAPDGTLWATDSDFDLQRWTWSKIWFWEKGKERGQPIVDRASKKEPWPEEIILGKTMPPQFKLDTMGHLYLIWERDTLNRHAQRFKVGRKTLVHGPPTFGGEKAVIVLDKDRRLIACVPWISSSLGVRHKWVKPLPDGSGFYRIQFLEKEAVIYFHPLPK